MNSDLVTQGMFCPDCGTLMTEGAVIFRCPKCGKTEIMSANDAMAKAAIAKHKGSSGQICFPTLAGRATVDGLPLITNSGHRQAL